MLFFSLAAMVGGVGGLSVGAIGGVFLGIASIWANRGQLIRFGAFCFAIGGGLATVLSWGQQMAKSESPWGLLAYAVAVMVAAAYAAAAGRRTAASISRTLETLEREQRKASLHASDQGPDDD